MDVKIRCATRGDTPALTDLIRLSALRLGATDYTTEQIEGALRGAFGVDTLLIDDGTYFVAAIGDQLVACGGWSPRRTLFGTDGRVDRDASPLDPKTDAARIRAFFVHPDFARRGIGRALVDRCESAAVMAGFKSAELMATLPGVRLYAACGYVGGAPVEYPLPAGGTIRFVPMRKALASA
jgi:GNAT superfamily N-acetyltransferase